MDNVVTTSNTSYYSDIKEVLKEFGVKLLM